MLISISKMSNRVFFFKFSSRSFDCLLDHTSIKRELKSIFCRAAWAIIVMIKQSYFWDHILAAVLFSEQLITERKSNFVFVLVRKEAQGRIPKWSQTLSFPSETFVTILPPLYASQLTLSESMIRASLNVNVFMHWFV